MSMLGRRRHLRYLLAQPVEGTIRVRDEVTVESLNEREIVVLSPEACRPGENVSLEVPGSGRNGVNATVADSRPMVADDGAICYRLTLLPGKSQVEAVAVAEESL